MVCMFLTRICHLTLIYSNLMIVGMSKQQKKRQTGTFKKPALPSKTAAKTSQPKSMPSTKAAPQISSAAAAKTNQPSRFDRLPIATPENFQMFEFECRSNGLILEQLVIVQNSIRNTFTMLKTFINYLFQRQKFGRCKHNTLKKFLSLNLESIITDYAACMFSWDGEYGGLAVKEYKIIEILKGMTWCVSW